MLRSRSKVLTITCRLKSLSAELLSTGKNVKNPSGHVPCANVWTNWYNPFHFYLCRKICIIVELKKKKLHQQKKRKSIKKKLINEYMWVSFCQRHMELTQQRTRSLVIQLAPAAPKPSISNVKFEYFGNQMLNLFIYFFIYYSTCNNRLEHYI